MTGPGLITPIPAKRLRLSVDRQTFRRTNWMFFVVEISDGRLRCEENPHLSIRINVIDFILISIKLCLRQLWTLSTNNVAAAVCHRRRRRHVYCVLHLKHWVFALCHLYSVSTLDKLKISSMHCKWHQMHRHTATHIPLTDVEQCKAAAATAAGAATNVYAIQLRLVVVPQNIIYDNSVSCSGGRVCSGYCTSCLACLCTWMSVCRLRAMNDTRIKLNAWK